MLNAKKAVHQTLLLIGNGFKKNEWDYSATFHRRSKRLNGYWSKMKTTDRPTVFQYANAQKKRDAYAHAHEINAIYHRPNAIYVFYLFIRSKNITQFQMRWKKPWHSAIALRSIWLERLLMELVSMIIQRSFVLILFSHKYIYTNEIQCKWSLAASFGLKSSRCHQPSRLAQFTALA